MNPTVALLLTICFLILPLQLVAFDVPFAPVAPVVDGDPADEAWARAEWVEMKHSILGAMPETEDFSGRYKLVWTEESLYLLAEITDDVLYDSHPDPLQFYWDDDTLEVFLDEDASGGDHQHNYNAFAYHIALDNQAVDIGPFLSARDEEAGKRNIRQYPHHVTSSWKRSLEDPNRIYWEVQIAVYPDHYKDEYTPGEKPVQPVTLHAGKQMGFMLAYCDSDGHREDRGREHFIGDIEIEPVNGDRNRGYIDAGVFGKITLVDQVNQEIEDRAWSPAPTDLRISREDYSNQLEGFWLGQCIANWTGLVTEMDKIGGEGPHGTFYTRKDWGRSDQPSIWGQGIPSDLSDNIDWVFEEPGGVWGADDDTDIEYMYQHLLLENQTSMLTGEQIRDGWLNHIYSDENTPFTNADGKPENYLWVSNQRAHDLMREEGLVPPATSDPKNNVEYEMIDAQLTTEIFGLFAPARPDIALKMAFLPIRTTARENAAWASEFYVVMYSLASRVDQRLPMKERVHWMANEARKWLPDVSVTARMFDFVKGRYEAGVPWEQARDDVYVRYQVDQMDGYDMTSREMYCNGCFASGINFAASMVSLFYGEGDFSETVKIAVLAGWDSDNPAATWGGLLGFMIGKDGIEAAFGRTFADRFNIHRTRGNFPNDGMDTFQAMAQKGILVIDRVVHEEMGGGIDREKNQWFIPPVGLENSLSSD